MKKLTVEQGLWPRLVRVLEESRPGPEPGDAVFAVFREHTEGRFMGLVTHPDIIAHPQWIFADLAEHRCWPTLLPTTSVDQALTMLESYRLEALPVMHESEFLGVVTRQSLIEALLREEQKLRCETQTLREQLAQEHEKTLLWAEKLSSLHDASRALLSIIGYTTMESDLLQAGIDTLARLLETRYGAIGIVNAEGGLETFIFSGLDSDQAKVIGRLPEGKGLLGRVIRNNESLRLEDMHRHPDFVGFPEGHPDMHSLLAVPIFRIGGVYGGFFLCEKLDGGPFTLMDEELAQSFAHSLSLMLDNRNQMEQVERANSQLEYLAHFDELTNLPNRTLLTDRLQQAFTHARREQRKVALLLIDIDDFKRINDTLGHGFGDQLLQYLATQVSQCLREEDTLARLGGDEFIVLLPLLNEAGDAARVAEKIQNRLKTPVSLEGQQLFVNVSVGISVFPDNATSADALLSSADAAMYKAKQLGKQNFQFFTADMNQRALENLRLEYHLRNALERSELTLHYQPQVDLKTGAIVAMEALLRWQNSELGAITPDRFIPLAEDSGMIVPIGAWVLVTAMIQAKVWRDQGWPIRVAVNLSARQFQPDADSLVSLIKNKLAELALPPEALELEITETILMERREQVLDALFTLKEMGIRIAVDDFGTGYSSLSYLKHFPVHALKIDKSFVDDLEYDDNDRAIVTAICALAKALGLEVIAEGVENASQLDYLRQQGCHWGQGYFIARPMPGAMTQEFICRYLSQAR